MKYPRILARITSTPWAILPSAFDSIVRALSDDSSPVLNQEVPANDGLQQEAVASIAIIPVAGIIAKHLSSLEIACGGCSLDHLREHFDAAVAQPDITDIVLYIDSPGGVVAGTPELARHMRTAAKAAGKRLHGFTDTLAASCAYWLASACDQIVCTPSATVGAIGVYMAVADLSKAREEAGVSVQLIKSGKFKDMGAGFRPLTEEEVAIFQSQVDALFALFKADIAAGRPGGVDAGVFEGQCFVGSQSTGVGLVDEIVPDFETFIRAIKQAVLAPAAVDTSANA